MTGRSRTWLLIFALVGLTGSALASYVHYRILFDPRYVSFCDVNETFNCSQVYMSRFGTFSGVPVAVFGRQSTNSIQRGYFQGPIVRFT